MDDDEGNVVGEAGRAQKRVEVNAGRAADGDEAAVDTASAVDTVDSQGTSHAPGPPPLVAPYEQFALVEENPARAPAVRLSMGAVQLLEEGARRQQTADPEDNTATNDVPSQEEMPSAEAKALQKKVFLAGFLIKLGNVRKNWKRRYFQLRAFRLEYRRKTSDKIAAGFIDLVGSAVELHLENDTEMLSIYSANQSRTFKLQFAGGYTLETWHAAIQERISALQNSVVCSRRQSRSLKGSINRSIRFASTRVSKQSDSKSQLQASSQLQQAQAQAQPQSPAPAAPTFVKLTVFQQGYLEKKAKHKWKRRYFQLKYGRLDYFKTQEIPLGTVIVSNSVVLTDPEPDSNGLKTFEVRSPFQRRTFLLRGPASVVDEWVAQLRLRKDDPRPVLDIDTFDAQTGDSTTIVAPLEKFGVRNSRLGDKFRKVASGPHLCRLFCNGKACKYCDYTRYEATSNVVQGLYANWVTESILAMSRPTTEAIEKCKVISQLQNQGVTAVINLQEKGEHQFCGFGNHECGYSYDPEAFTQAGIRVHCFGWKDFGVPNMDHAFSMVKTVAEEVAQGKVAVHCHAGLGRTGMIIACALVYLLGYTGEEAISYTRVRRKGSIQTRKQVGFVKDFYKSLTRCRRLFLMEGISGPDNGLASYVTSTVDLETQLKRQSMCLLDSECASIRRVPRLFRDACLSLAKADWRSYLETTRYPFTSTTAANAALLEPISEAVKKIKIEINHGSWVALAESRDIDVLQCLLESWAAITPDVLFEPSEVDALRAIIKAGTVGSAWQSAVSASAQAIVLCVVHVIRGIITQCGLSTDSPAEGTVPAVCQFSYLAACLLHKTSVSTLGEMETQQLWSCVRGIAGKASHGEQSAAAMAKAQRSSALTLCMLMMALAVLDQSEQEAALMQSAVHAGALALDMPLSVDAQVPTKSGLSYDDGSHEADELQAADSTAHTPAKRASQLLSRKLVTSAATARQSVLEQGLAPSRTNTLTSVAVHETLAMEDYESSSSSSSSDDESEVEVEDDGSGDVTVKGMTIT